MAKEVSKEISFEDAMQQLQNIVSELEKGTLNLDDSVKKFEEGVTLSKQCNEMLEKAEKKINLLIKKEDKFEEEKFEVE